MRKSNRQSFILFLCALSLITFMRCGGCSDATTGDLPDGGDDAGTDGGGLSCANFAESCLTGPDCCSGLCDTNTMKCQASCGAFDQSCSNNVDCCSGICDQATRKCTQPASCSPVGATCTLGTDCCSLSCVGGKCQTGCTSDGQTCTSGGQCCSGSCTGTPAVCGAINPGAGCKSSGNGCSANGDCCSGLCTGTPKTCSTASSFCHQTNDVCAKNADCCSTNCVINAPNQLGSCQPNATSGAGGCAIAGTLCTGACSCCSALCAPYASGPTKVCQNASGCHLTGDLCTKTSDCCGAPGTGLPGEGNVYCNIAAGAKIGVCHKASGCQPEGGLCKYSGMTSSCTSFRNDCCDAPGSRTAAVCKLDTEGIPRCYGLKDGMCVPAGGNCSASFDCCNNQACVPDAMGVLRCGTMGMACSPSGGPCTVAADCCDTGYNCVTAAGSVQGVCTAPTTMPPPDGGMPADMALCANYGQACSVGGTPCCNSVPCSAPGGGGTACGPGQTGCTCYMLIP